MKNKFYIFLDIDGVLWDWKWRKDQIAKGNIKKGGIVTSINPESVLALNLILKKMSHNFEPVLVISSAWKANLSNVDKLLKGNGLDYDKPLLKTKTDTNRFEEIKKFLNDLKEKANFLVIDDVLLPLPKKFFIQTNIVDGCLNKQKVLEWFEVYENCKKL